MTLSPQPSLFDADAADIIARLTTALRAQFRDGAEHTVSCLALRERWGSRCVGDCLLAREALGMHTIKDNDEHSH